MYNHIKSKDIRNCYQFGNTLHTYSVILQSIQQLLNVSLQVLTNPTPYALRGNSAELRRTAWSSGLKGIFHPCRQPELDTWCWQGKTIVCSAKKSSCIVWYILVLNWQTKKMVDCKDVYNTDFHIFNFSKQESLPKYVILTSNVCTSINQLVIS